MLVGDRGERSVLDALFCCLFWGRFLPPATHARIHTHISLSLSLSLGLVPSLISISATPSPCGRVMRLVCGAGVAGIRTRRAARRSCTLRHRDGSPLSTSCSAATLASPPKCRVSHNRVLIRSSTGQGQGEARTRILAMGPFPPFPARKRCSCVQRTPCTMVMRFPIDIVALLWEPNSLTMLMPFAPLPPPRRRRPYKRAGHCGCRPARRRRRPYKRAGHCGRRPAGADAARRAAGGGAARPARAGALPA